MVSVMIRVRLLLKISKPSLNHEIFGNGVPVNWTTNSAYAEDRVLPNIASPNIASILISAAVRVRTYLFVLERHRVLELEIETWRAGGSDRPLQRYREWLGQLARLRQTESVLRPHAELVTPSWLETAQSQLWECAEAGGAP